MRIYQLRIIVACGLLATISCKKTEQPVIPDQLNASQTTFATTAYRPLTVITMAGVDYDFGNIDGPGNQAKFGILSDIKITEDGNIYVVDYLNNSIRKISTDNVVSTIPIPPSADGRTLENPQNIFIAKDGTMTILAGVEYGDQTRHPFWIVSPTGQVTTPSPRKDSYWNYSYLNIAYDPYSNFLKACGGRQVIQATNHYTPFMEDLEIKNGIIGANRYIPPIDSFQKEYQGQSVFDLMFCGYNGVKYFVARNHQIYKLTPSGVFTRIYRDMDLRVTSLVATKDSRTIYITNRGRIEAISNGKKTFLVGPNYTDYSSRDGVGSAANVQAYKLALSKDENTIYFVDQDRNTVRKLILK